MPITVVSSGHPVCTRCGARMPSTGPLCLRCRGLVPNEALDYLRACECGRMPVVPSTGRCPRCTYGREEEHGRE